MPTIPPSRPSPCRVHAFIDGQNLFHSVKRAWGYKYPSFDPQKLANAVCGLAKDRKLVQVHFYTGVPPQDKDPRWNAFWSAKIRAMTGAGVRVTTRPLRYSQGPVILKGTVIHDALIAREKGIDLRLGLDVLRLARHGDFDAALIFSQDGDLAEVVQEIGALRKEMSKWLVVDCALPAGAGFGIAGAQPLVFDKALYDACIDPADYFPPDKTPNLPGVS